MPETPRYRLRSGSYIEGLGVLDGAADAPVEYDLPYPRINPRNSWEPVNDAAREAFKRRNEKILARQQARIDEVQQYVDDAKKAGADVAELAGFIDQLAKLRVEMAELPLKLKAVPTVGPPSQYTFSESTPIGALGSQANLDETVERLVDAARAGGASESDIKQLRAALASGNSQKLPSEGGEPVSADTKTLLAGAKADASKAKVQEKLVPVPKRASDS